MPRFYRPFEPSLVLFTSFGSLDKTSAKQTKTRSQKDPAKASTAQTSSVGATSERVARDGHAEDETGVGGRHADSCG